MIALNLIDSLVVKLKEIFLNYELPAKSGLLQNVKVFAQYLPQPRSVTVTTEDDDGDESDNGSEIEPQGYTPEDIESNFPCVIVKFDDETDREEGALDATRINVRILVGCYDESPNCQGYRDVMNVIEIVRQMILENRVLDKKYRLEMPMKSYLFDDQPYPIFFGQIETVWETGRPLMTRKGVYFNGRNCH